MAKRAKKPATLIWHRDPALLSERDWIRDLLSESVQDEIVDADGQCCLPHSIIVKSSCVKTPDSLFGMTAACRPIGLFHISDEYLSFDYKIYSCFDFVIRMYRSSVFEVDRILVVPLGYASDLSFRTPVLPASQRQMLWSFAGQLKSSRYAMVQSLAQVQPNTVHTIASRDDELTREEYVELLSDSVFAPCPMGNVMMESWRLYESLEAGCIPIVERRRFLAYYENLLDSPPLIFIRSWKEAKHKILELAGDRNELDRLQRCVHGWWLDYKVSLKERVTRHVAEGFARSANATGPVIRVKWVAKVPGWYYGELLRHQSLTSLRWRARRNLLSGRLNVPF